MTFPDAERETGFICGVRRTCYDSFYPFKVLSARGLERIDFEPVTILYGGNGSGKTTALNVIAERIGVRRGVDLQPLRAFSPITWTCAPCA